MIACDELAKKISMRTKLRKRLFLQTEYERMLLMAANVLQLDGEAGGRRPEVALG